MGATAGFAFSAFSSISGSNSQAAAQRQQAEFSASQYAQNSKIAEEQAEDAETRGKRNAEIAGVQTKQRIGAQRAAAAASGVDVNSGSALDLQADTAAQGAMDKLTIKNNAWREAWGYKVQAASAGSMSGFTAAAGANASNNTLLTGGMNAVGSGLKGWDSYSKNNRSVAAVDYGDD